MIRPAYFFIIASLLIWSCNNGNKKNNSDSRVPEPDLIQRLRSQKTLLDTFYQRNQKNLTRFIKLEDNDTLIEGTNDEEYDGIETTYTILRDSTGKILTASEFPFSQSGDWYIVVSHYFDDNGNTFAVDRQTNFFNNGCTDGAAFETITLYYRENLNLIDSTYKLTDQNNKPLQKDSCAFLYNYDFKAAANVKQWLEAHKITTGRGLKLK